MRVYLIILFCLASFFVMGQSADEIEVLIAKLGSPSYLERKEASDALRMMGLPAREALERAVLSDDPETRLRAAQILRDIKHGVNPTWPEETRNKVRDFDKLDRTAKKTLMEQLVNKHGKEAIPFLLMRVEKGEGTDADQAVKLLSKMVPEKAVWNAVLGRKRKTVNKYEARLLVAACAWSKEPADIARALESEHLESSGKSNLMNTAMKMLKEQYEAKAYSKVIKHGKLFGESAKNDARFYYLRAMAYSKLGKDHEASETAKKALSLNPDKEAAHYTAGEMLLEMGKLRLSEMEWKKILEIPPAGDVYDLNAYMRLGSIYAQRKMYAEAVEMLEIGKKKYKEAKETHGKSMGMIGADQLDGYIARYKKLARRGNVIGQEPVEHVEIDEDSAIGGLKITITPTVKGGKGKEMIKDLNAVVATMTSNVKPYGFRLFEKAAAGIQYFPKKQELAILLNGSPCTKPTDCVLKKKISRVALYSLDMCYIFTVDRDSGKAEKVKTYEKDYVLKLQPGTKILAWDGASIRINGKKYSWQEYAKGIPFDYLPEKLELDIRGTTLDGEKMDHKNSFDPARFMKGGGKDVRPTVIKLSIEVK